MINDRLLDAITDANARVPDVTFLALLGRPNQPVTLCMCSDYLLPLTLYEGDTIELALIALEKAVLSLVQSRAAS